MIDVCCEKEKIDETRLFRMKKKNETKPSEKKWPIKIDTTPFVVI